MSQIARMTQLGPVFIKMTSHERITRIRKIMIKHIDILRAELKNSIALAFNIKIFALINSHDIKINIYIFVNK